MAQPVEQPLIAALDIGSSKVSAMVWAWVMPERKMVCSWNKASWVFFSPAWAAPQSTSASPATSAIFFINPLPDNP